MRGGYVVAALAMIALIGSIVLVFAQQGYNLPGINTLATTIGSKGLFTILSLAVVALLINSTWMIKNVRGQARNALREQRDLDLLEERRQLQLVEERRPYTLKEAFKLIPPSEYHHVMILCSERIGENRYHTLDIARLDKKGSVFALIFAGNEPLQQFFKTKDARDYALEQLLLTHPNHKPRHPPK